MIPAGKQQMQFRSLIFVFSLISAACLPAIAQTVPAAQSGHSDSIAYEPRVLPKPAGKNKKGKNVASAKEPASVGRAGPNAIREISLTLPVSVIDGKGQLVTDLRQSDFEVYLDQTKAEIRSFGVNSEPATVIFLIDVSPSATFGAKAVQQQVLKALDDVRPDDKVWMIAFDSSLRILGEPTADRSLLRKYASKLRMGQGTSIYEAIKNLFEKQILRIAGRKAVVLFTDGVDTTSEHATYETSLVAAEKAAVPVFVVYLDTSAQASKATIRFSPGAFVTSLPPEIFEAIRRSAGRAYSPQIVQAEYEYGKLYLNDLVFLSGGRAMRSEQIGTDEVPAGVGTRMGKEYELNVTAKINAVAGERVQVRVRVKRPDLAVMARGSFIVE